MEKIEKQEAIAKVLNSSKESISHDTSSDMFKLVVDKKIVDCNMVDCPTIQQNMAGMSEFTKFIAGPGHADFLTKKRSAALKSELMVQEQSKDSGLMA